MFVCEECLDKAKDNFVWLCMQCGKSYFRPKKMIIDRLKDYELKRAYILCEDMVIIQGISMCVACDSEGILQYTSLTGEFNA